MKIMNEEILKYGKVTESMKVPVLTISLGKVGELKEIPGVIFRKDGVTYIVTKENPNGNPYSDDNIAVVRVIGGKVLISGKYDIYALSEEKASKKLSNPVENFELNIKSVVELAPILAAKGNTPEVFMSRPERRKVIKVTNELCCRLNGSSEYPLYIQDEWNFGTDIYTEVYPGDRIMLEGQMASIFTI